MKITKISKMIYIINGERIDTRKARACKTMGSFRNALTDYFKSKGMTWLAADTLYCDLHNKIFASVFNVLDAAAAISLEIDIKSRSAWTSRGGFIQNGATYPTPLADEHDAARRTKHP